MEKYRIAFTVQDYYDYVGTYLKGMDITLNSNVFLVIGINTIEYICQLECLKKKLKKFQIGGIDLPILDLIMFHIN